MRAAAVFALFALATRSTAIFCFVRQKKCLPGVELSLDYDQLPSLLGVSVTQTVELAKTGASSASPTVMLNETNPVHVVETRSPQLASRATTTRYNTLLSIPTPGVLATPSAPLAALGLPESPPQPTSKSVQSRDPIPTPEAARASLPVPALPGLIAPIIPPAPLIPANPSPIVPAVQAAPAPMVAALPASAPAAMGPIPFASPSSIVPDSIRNLIPRGDEKIYGAAGCYSGSCVTESADADSQRKDQASHASHNSENSTQPLPHKTHALPIPSLNVEFPRFPLGPAVLQVPGSAIEAPIFNLTTKAFTVVFSLHTAGSSVTSATAKEVDCTTTLTEWITVTPTSTSNALKYTSAHKETHQVLLPKPSGPQTKTEAVLLPKPSASHTQTPAVVSMILTVETLLPGPTSTSFSTVASYTPLQKPAELPPSSHISSQYKSGSYNAPSNTAATHSAEDLMLVVTKPTRYVTPIPVAQPSWSRIQNSSSTGMAKPQQPEQYMGAAVTNSLDVVFLIVAGVAALMTI